MGIPREYNPFGLHVQVTVMESGLDIFIYCLSAKSKLHKRMCPMEAKGEGYESGGSARLVYCLDL